MACNVRVVHACFVNTVYGIEYIIRLRMRTYILHFYFKNIQNQ